MVRRAERIIPKRYETDLPQGDFKTINLFDPHSRVPEDQLREAVDYDLFPGYIKSRRGSTNLGSASQKLGDRNVLEGVIWDIGDVDYAIVQQVNSGATGTEFFFSQVNPTPSTWTQIQTLAAANLTIADTTAADMFISGDKLYVFHSLGNYIIQWSGSAFVARPMGIANATISSVASGGAGNLTGKYTWGVELVYQVSSVDIVASTPWRKDTNGAVVSATLSANSANITVHSASLPAAPGDYWTHVRLWRSYNQNPDYSDPLNPVDAAGVPDELYPVKLVTKAALVSASYVINDDIPDDQLPAETTSEYPVVDIGLIELSKLPAAKVGVYHRDRIWASQAQGIADTSQGRIVYTNSAGDAYGECYNPLNIVKTEPGDTQKTIKLISFERDLIGIKEGKTGRIQDGNPDLGFETLDHSIGISHRKLARYVPKIGICAITNDQGEFKILGYDLRWQNVVNGIDLSRVIREQTEAFTGTYSSFTYANGKLLITDGDNAFYALHAKEFLGWTKYEYAFTTAQLVLPFANSTRIAVISKNAYVLEIERDDLDTDVDTSSDAQTIISPYFITPQFKSRGGRDIIEMRYHSVIAKIANDLDAIPYVNGKYWPEPETANASDYTPPASAYTAGDAGLEREYRLFSEPPRPVGNFIHFKVMTTAPVTIHSGMLRAFVDEVGMGAGHFDPFGNLTDADATPDWIDVLEYDAVDGERDVGSMVELDAGDGARTIADFEEIDRDA